METRHMCDLKNARLVLTTAEGVQASFKIIDEDLPMFCREEVEMLGEVLWQFLQNSDDERLTRAARHIFSAIDRAYFERFGKIMPNTGDRVSEELRLNNLGDDFCAEEKQRDGEKD